MGMLLGSLQLFIIVKNISNEQHRMKWHFRSTYQSPMVSVTRHRPLGHPPTMAKSSSEHIMLASSIIGGRDKLCSSNIHCHTTCPGTIRGGRA
mmetsp:Transcript_22053/g.33674  ORF Transcript_22053/g.33674 Transcript_22053/m.33674 type:complete len:93 (+) Transcript_22053:3-281(+)